MSVAVDRHENGLVAWLSPSNGSGVKLHGSLVAGIVAWVEVIAFLGETFLSMIISLACRSLFHAAATLVWPHDTTTTSLGDVVWDALFVCVNLLRRSAGNFHQPSISTWITRLGLRPTALSQLTRGWIVYQIAGFLAFVGYQHVANDWVMSWANYYGSSKDSVQWPHVLEILVLSPLKEELVFRGLVYHLLLNRIPKPMVAGLVSSILFGCMHLVNLKQSKFSTMYVLIQMGLGVEIGFFYSLTYARTGSLFECVVLHVVNNVLSSFTSTEMELSSSPWLAALLVHSILWYALLIYLSHQALRAQTRR
ncbi:hypothetical protein LEN26_009003 [Aphanomyces euteiches]|nr:hypothetical protein AeMF1_013657 [Aphanomyces euteiches]KAH9129368.1 hypothetical protein LEN26_009003 [Aphanomyces euteiches]KAH9189936.1 hypothetical protein AeNC1_008086 [Aphanomyces euteiches]